MFQDCQRRAGHPLPLGAYLLKPVQRITKYQLLLRELERHCSRESRPHVERALKAMLDLLAQINAAIHQLHISGFNVGLSPPVTAKSSSSESQIFDPRIETLWLRVICPLVPYYSGVETPARKDKGVRAHCRQTAGLTRVLERCPSRQCNA